MAGQQPGPAIVRELSQVLQRLREVDLQPRCFGLDRPIHIPQVLQRGPGALAVATLLHTRKLILHYGVEILHERWGDLSTQWVRHCGRQTRQVAYRSEE